MEFRDLKIGDRFIFESEASLKRLYSGLAYGPWIKTGSRTYRHADELDVRKKPNKVGTISVKVLQLRHN